MFRSQKEPVVNQCQSSPVQKHSRDGAAAQDLAAVGRESTDDGGPVRAVIGDVQRSPGDITIAVSDADSATNTSCVADESQPVTSHHGRFN